LTLCANARWSLGIGHWALGIGHWALGIGIGHQFSYNCVITNNRTNTWQRYLAAL